MECRFVLIRKICELQILRFVHNIQFITKFLNRNSSVDVLSVKGYERPSENDGNGNENAALKVWIRRTVAFQSTKLFRFEILGIPCDG